MTLQISPAGRGEGRGRRFALLPLILLLLSLCACRSEAPRPSDAVAPLRIGYENSPLLAPFFAATAQPATGPSWRPTHFKSGGDIGYALLAGEVDAGFVTTDKARKLLLAPGGEQLKVVGSITFPFGATLVLRKDLNLRLADLAGRKVAAEADDCSLFLQFNSDLQRFGVDPQKIRFSWLPFSEMLPALETGVVDAALVKGSYGVLAELAGHKILYQKWDIPAGGDDCCPAALAQIEYLLIVRAEKVEKIAPLTRGLQAANDLPVATIRVAVSKELGYPEGALERLSLASYSDLTEELRKTLGEQACAAVR